MEVSEETADPLRDENRKSKSKCKGLQEQKQIPADDNKKSKSNGYNYGQERRLQLRPQGTRATAVTTKLVNQRTATIAIVQFVGRRPGNTDFARSRISWRDTIVKRTRSARNGRLQSNGISHLTIDPRTAGLEGCSVQLHRECCLCNVAAARKLAQDLNELPGRKGRRGSRRLRGR